MDKNCEEILEFIGRHEDGVTFYQLVRGFGFPDTSYDLQEILRHFIAENLTELTQAENGVNSKYFITKSGMEQILTNPKGGRDS